MNKYTHRYIHTQTQFAAFCSVYNLQISSQAFERQPIAESRDGASPGTWPNVMWFRPMGLYIYICMYMCICVCVCVYMHISITTKQVIEATL